jgi:hypothetical protein
MRAFPFFATSHSCGDREVPFIVSAGSARGLLDRKPHENHKVASASIQYGGDKPEFGKIDA